MDEDGAALKQLGALVGAKRETIQRKANQALFDWLREPLSSTWFSLA